MHKFLISAVPLLALSHRGGDAFHVGSCGAPRSLNARVGLRRRGAGSVRKDSPVVAPRSVAADHPDAGKPHSRPAAASTVGVAELDEDWAPSLGATGGNSPANDAILELPTEEPAQANSTAAIGETDEGIVVAPLFPPTPTLRECLSFAVPALGIYAAPPLMSLIDAAFIGRTSSVELAALGPASSISDSAALPLLFLSIAATNLVAKSADAPSDRARVTRACLGLGAVGGSVLAALVYLKSGVLSALYCGANAATLAPLCSSYVTIRALALPAVVLATIAQAVCIGVKDTKTPMIAVALASVLNLFGDLVLVSGLGLGIAGAAWATSASQICAAGLLLRVLAKRGLLRRVWGADVIGETRETIEAGGFGENGRSNGGDAGAAATTTRDTLASILGFVPFLFVMAVKIGMHNSAAATAASLGGAPAAAHTALFAVAMLCFTFGDVGSSLSQAFLPAFSIITKDSGGDDDNDGIAAKSSGSKKVAPPDFDIAAARPTIAQLLKCTFSISATVVLISSSLLTVFAGQITRDAEVMKQMRSALPLMVATLSLHGTAVTLEGLLLARQNFRGLTLTYSAVAVSVAGLLSLVKVSGVGLLGIWGTYVWFQLSRVVAFSAFGGLLRPSLSKLKAKLKPIRCQLPTVPSSIVP